MAIIDSQLASLEEAIEGIKVPEEIQGNLALVSVSYLSFDNEVHTGQLVIHKDLAGDVVEIFSELLEIRFPIERVVPVVVYRWDDSRSMNANNSSALNIRFINDGTGRYSLHSYGWCIDLNPMQNPCIGRDGSIDPPHAAHDPAVPGTITADSRVVAIFEKRGWIWGGKWTSLKDYMHFEKRLDGELS